MKRLFLFLLVGILTVSLGYGIGEVEWTKFEGSKYNLAAIAVDETGIYYGGASPAGSNYRWLVRKRDSSGNLIWSQSANYGYSSKTSQVYDIDLDSNYLYLGGSRSGIRSAEAVYEKRRKDNGQRLGYGIQCRNGCPNGNKDPTRYYGVAVDPNSNYFFVGGIRDRASLKNHPLIHGRAKSSLGIYWTKTPSTDKLVTSMDFYNSYLYVLTNQDASPDRWLIEKYTRGGGLSRSAVQSGNDQGRSITSGDNKIFISGGSKSGSNRILFQARNQNLGVLWNRWAPGGTYQGGHSVFAGEHLIGNYNNVLVGYNKDNGNIDWQLTSTSVTTANYYGSTYYNYLNMDSDCSSLYLVGVDYPGRNYNNMRGFIEKRVLGGEKYADKGLRIYDGDEVHPVGLEPEGTLTSPLRIAIEGTTYGIALTDVGAAGSLPIHVETSSGTKALVGVGAGAAGGASC